MRNMPHRGTLIVSLDFELFWGMQDCVSLEDYRENILGGCKAIPRLLELFTRYGIHATWAAVGFLFAKDQNELKAYFPEENMRPTYANKMLSSYRCFSSMEESKEPKCFYAPELIERIAETKGQEIGSHTFSHYYCREEGQTLQQFEADMKAALAIAQDHGYSLTSAVLPRNQCSEPYIAVLRDLGFNAYRDEENDWIHERIGIRPFMRLLRLADVYFPLTGQGGYIPKNENGIWNFAGSRMYKPLLKPLFVMEKMKIRRIKKQMLHAAQKGLVFHLWWHPHNIGIMTDYHMQQLEDIFEYYELLRNQYGMRSMNMHEAAIEFAQNDGC